MGCFFFRLVLVLFLTLCAVSSQNNAPPQLQLKPLTKWEEPLPPSRLLQSAALESESYRELQYPGKAVRADLLQGPKITRA
jgi:hypothetical protein